MENNESWLKKDFDIYLSPEYYEEILPEYSFGGKSDEEILEEYLASEVQKRGANFSCALELGCGTGRGTKILQKYCDKIISVDLNPHMVEISRRRFQKSQKIEFHVSEMLDFAKKGTLPDIDFVVAFWSINYSLNAEFAKRVPKHGVFEAKNQHEALRKCHEKLDGLFNVLSSGTKFVFFHYDPESEEQKIAHACWEKILPSPFSEKSPSLYAIRKYLEKQNSINSCICKLNGKVPLGSEEKAIEIFMNFHLHTSFNQHEMRDEIISLIKGELEDYSSDDSTIGAGAIIIKGQVL